MRVFLATLSWVAITIGFVLLVASAFVPRDHLAFAWFLGLGIALLPCGVIAIITHQTSSRVIEESLKDRIEALAASLRAALDRLHKTMAYLDRSASLGVTMLYPDRSAALKEFLGRVVGYVQDRARGPREVVFVASSLKGVTESEQYSQQLCRIVEEARADPAGCQCFFLLTHPFYSRYREAQEDRPPTAIAREILKTIRMLDDMRGNSLNIHIRVYKGTPTCFMIATSESMLINPYPYEREAYRCFSLEVEANPNPDGIWSMYHTYHFSKPWQSGDTTTVKPSVANALPYTHHRLDGPIPDPDRKATGEPDSYGDAFLILDEGSFYLAVEVHGLKREIPYDPKPNGSKESLAIGSQLEIKLLRLPPQGEAIWDKVDDLALDHERKGFWHGCWDEHAFGAYSMLGVFDPRQESPFLHRPDAHPSLRGKPLPILWKWLVSKPTGSA